MKRMIFKVDDVIGKGIQSTVRRGDKWLELEPNEELDLRNAEQVELGTGVVSFVAAFDDVADIPDFLLQTNYSPAARTQEGLAEQLAIAYGPDWRESEDGFTVVVFVV